MAVPAERQFSKGPIALRCDAICSKLVRGIYSGISYESILETFVLDISQEDIDPTAGLDRYIDLEWVYQNASSDQLIRERLIEGELS